MSDLAKGQSLKEFEEDLNKKEKVILDLYEKWRKGDITEEKFRENLVEICNELNVGLLKLWIEETVKLLVK